MLPALESLSLSGGSPTSGDISTPFHQTFGGAGSPFGSGLTFKDLILPLALLAVVLVVVLRRKG